MNSAVAAILLVAIAIPAMTISGIVLSESRHRRETCLAAGVGVVGVAALFAAGLILWMSL